MVCRAFGGMCIVWRGVQERDKWVSTETESHQESQGSSDESRTPENRRERETDYEIGESIEPTHRS